MYCLFFIDAMMFSLFINEKASESVSFPQKQLNILHFAP